MYVSLSGPLSRKIDAMFAAGFRPYEKPKPISIDVSRRRFSDAMLKLDRKPVIVKPREGWVTPPPAPIKPFRPTIDRIQRAVAMVTEVSVEEQKSEARWREAARARQIAMYLAKEMTARSLPEIGRCFGDRDHTTVLHALCRITALIADDRAVAAKVDAVRALLQSEGF